MLISPQSVTHDDDDDDGYAKIATSKSKPHCKIALIALGHSQKTSSWTFVPLYFKISFSRSEMSNENLILSIFFSVTTNVQMNTIIELVSLFFSRSKQIFELKLKYISRFNGGFHVSHIKSNEWELLNCLSRLKIKKHQLLLVLVESKMSPKTVCWVEGFCFSLSSSFQCVS